MKAIHKLEALITSEFKPEVILLTFSSQGIKIRRRGYALVALTSDKSTRMEYLTIEPVSYSDGDKWMYHGVLADLVFGYHAVHYAKNIHQVIKKLNKKS